MTDGAVDASVGVEHYDYVIVGAGSAGCVLAERLSADLRTSVLVVEAGGRDRHPMIHIPKGIGRTHGNPDLTWVYPVETPPGFSADRDEKWIRGTGLGGSSSVNGMIYIRGHPEDYRQWVAQGAVGWGWTDMLPAFRAIERHELGDSPTRGGRGPLPISVGGVRYPLSERFIAIGESMGLPRKDDLNDGDQEGIGYYAHTIWRGRRQSAARIFLKPAERRRRVRVLTHARAQRVLFDGNRATGVRVRISGQLRDYAADREVILSAGALESPRLLQLSGIGPASLLRRHGIPVIVDRGDVGRKMREHICFAMPHRLRGERGLNHRLRGWGLWRTAVRYLATRGGLLAGGPFEVGGFARVGPGATRPDLQLFLSALTFTTVPGVMPARLTTESEPGMTIYSAILNCTSEGSVAIRSADAADPPVIQPNWLATPQDQATAIAALRYMRAFMHSPLLDAYRGAEMSPGEEVRTDDDLLAAYRQLATSGLHAVATCRMGSDEEAVTDPALKVRGVDGLRVVDCSVMPGPISGNTNGPVMALAWRAAERIASNR